MAAAVQRRCGSGMRSSHGPRRTDGLDATVVRLDEDSRDEDIRQRYVNEMQARCALSDIADGWV